MEPLYALLADIAHRVRRWLPLLAANLVMAMLLAAAVALAPAASAQRALLALEAALASDALGFVLATQLLSCALVLAWQAMLDRRRPASALMPLRWLEPLVDFSLALVMVACSYLLAFALALKVYGHDGAAREVMQTMAAVMLLGLAFATLPSLTAPTVVGSKRRRLSGWSAALVGTALVLALLVLPEGGRPTPQAAGVPLDGGAADAAAQSAR